MCGSCARQEGLTREHDPLWLTQRSTGGDDEGDGLINCADCRFESHRPLNPLGVLIRPSRSNSEGGTMASTGVSQSSEIVPHADIRFVGGLPPPYARTTGYSAAMVTDKAGSRALLAFLGSDLARQTWRASGFVDR